MSSTTYKEVSYYEIDGLIYRSTKTELLVYEPSMKSFVKSLYDDMRQVEKLFHEKSQPISTKRLILLGIL